MTRHKISKELVTYKNGTEHNRRVYSARISEDGDMAERYNGRMKKAWKKLEQKQKRPLVFI